MSRASSEECGPVGEAAAVFGPALAQARRYAELLRGDGVDHGHIGPREADRLWDRHLLNCAVVTDLVPVGCELLDVGSGAGLPGLPMAIRRPDLRVTLLEPMQRRVGFLTRCIEELELVDRVRVVRGRAGDPAVASRVGRAVVVTARAVASLDRLVGWCSPLLADDGTMLAIKGERAAAEVDEHRGAVERAGMRVMSIAELPAGDSTTRVVVLERKPGPRRTSADRRGE